MHPNTFAVLKWGLLLAALMLVASSSAAGTTATMPQANKRSSSAIAITADGATLLVVNPDSNSLTLVDVVSRTVVTELPVGQDPRAVAVDDAGRRAYVANRGSDTVSVVDLTTYQVIAQVSVGRRPYGVVVDPDGDWLCVAEQGADQVRVLDTATFATLSVHPTADRPSGLSVGDDGTTLYVTHALGNAITVLSVYSYRTYFPLVMVNWEVGKLVDEEMASPIDQLPIYQSTNYQSTTIPLWPDSNLVQAIVLSPDGTTAYVPHTRSNTSNQALTFDTTVFPLVSLVDLSAQQHLIGQQIDLGTLDPPGVGLPFDAALTPDGGELWVVNAASNDVSVLDLPTRHLAAHIEVGDNPRGITLSPDGATAYVNNTLAGTVSVIDTAAYTVTDVITVTDIPLPPILLNGKRLFHTSDDPRLAKNQWISCNTCHFEGEHDGRTWFFGFAGPRNTTGLLGMVETYPLRWSGEWDESADSEFANRRENFGSGLIDGAMNCTLSPPDCVDQPPNQGRSYDLDSLAAFIDSLQVVSSPGHVHGEPLTGAELRGQAIFNDPALSCASCHPPPLYTDLQMHDVGTATSDERIGPAYDTPSLRGLYDSAPYFHDGSAATLRDAVTRPTAGSEHDVSGALTEEEIEDLIAFLLVLPFEQ
jgi:YVTN family beta-propeller protein